MKRDATGKMDVVLLGVNRRDELHGGEICFGFSPEWWQPREKTGATVENGSLSRRRETCTSLGHWCKRQEPENRDGVLVPVHRPACYNPVLPAMV